MYCYYLRIHRLYINESFVIYDTAMILLFPRVYYCYDSLIYDCFIIISCLTGTLQGVRIMIVLVYKQVAARFRV